MTKWSIYVSLCMIWGSHNGGYEEFCLLRYNAMHSFESRPTFRRTRCSALLPSSCWFVAWLIFLPWRRSQHVPPKRRLVLHRQHSVISKKIDLLTDVMNPDSNYLTLNIIFYVKCLIYITPIIVAVRSTAWTVFVRSNAGFVGSNPTQGMGVVCVYVRLFCLCCPVCR
jgi:hypothetical protein